MNENDVLNALRAIEDPDLHKDIVTLGFVKDIQIKGSRVSVKVELTTPACPLKEVIERKNLRQNIELKPGDTVIVP